MKDHIIAGKHEDTGLWHGLFYVNHPTPSGWDRPVLKYSTKLGYVTEQEAVEAMKKVFTPEKLKNIDVCNNSAKNNQVNQVNPVKNN